MEARYQRGHVSGCNVVLDRRVSTLPVAEIAARMILIRYLCFMSGFVETSLQCFNIEGKFHILDQTLVALPRHESHDF